MSGLDLPGNSTSVLAALEHVAVCAANYRKEEQATTPRMYRGKALHDLGVSLDTALDDLTKARSVENEDA